MKCKRTFWFSHPSTCPLQSSIARNTSHTTPLVFKESSPTLIEGQLHLTTYHPASFSHSLQHFCTNTIHFLTTLHARLRTSRRSLSNETNVRNVEGALTGCFRLISWWVHSTSLHISAIVFPCLCFGPRGRFRYTSPILTFQLLRRRKEKQ